VHEETLVDPLLVSPNDLVALPNGQIYVSNEVTYRGVLRRLLELAHVMSSSGVVHLAPSESGWRARIVVEGIRYANGVAVSENRLFVAGVLDEAIHEFMRDPSTGDVGARIREIPIGSGVDNLMWSGPQLIAAAHPSLVRFLLHAEDESRNSPSELYRVDPRTDPPAVELVHSNDGSVISGASTGVEYGDTLYISQVFGAGIVACRR
jgi:hypothetical protein